MFQEALLKFNNQIKSEVADGKSKELFPFIQTGAQALLKVYPQEISLWMKTKGVDKVLKNMSSVVENLNELLSSYVVNDEIGRIELTTDDGSETSYPLISLDGVIKDYFRMTPDDEHYFLLLGILMIPQNFELVQLYQATNKMAGL